MLNKPYSPSAWFWIVGGDDTQVYSSSMPGFVPITDAAYATWLEDGGLPTSIASLDELRDVLLAQAPAGWSSALDTLPQAKARLTTAVQDHLDGTAQSHGYDGILSLASYATSTNAKFSAEGKAGVQWRDDVWAYCWQVLSAVEAGRREIPTADALVAELPPMVWP